MASHICATCDGRGSTRRTRAKPGPPGTGGKQEFVYENVPCYICGGTGRIERDEKNEVRSARSESRTARGTAWALVLLLVFLLLLVGRSLQDDLPWLRMPPDEPAAAPPVAEKVPEAPPAEPEAEPRTIDELFRQEDYAYPPYDKRAVDGSGRRPLPYPNVARVQRAPDEGMFGVYLYGDELVAVETTDRGFDAEAVEYNVIDRHFRIRQADGSYRTIEGVVEYMDVATMKSATEMTYALARPDQKFDFGSSYIDSRRVPLVLTMDEPPSQP